MSEHHFWTADRVAKLREWWGDGRSAAEISRRFDEKVSRSAVIGKAHRLGLKHGYKRTPTIRSTKTRQAGPVTVIAREFYSSSIKTRGALPALRNLKIEPLAEIVDLPAPPHQRRTIATLTPTCCRWPVGDPQKPDFHFCGANHVPGLPYCPTHAQRAYRAIPVKQAVEPEKVDA